MVKKVHTVQCTNWNVTIKLFCFVLGFDTKETYCYSTKVYSRFISAKNNTSGTNIAWTSIRISDDKIVVLRVLTGYCSGGGSLIGLKNSPGGGGLFIIGLPYGWNNPPFSYKNARRARKYTTRTSSKNIEYLIKVCDYFSTFGFLQNRDSNPTQWYSINFQLLGYCKIKIPMKSNGIPSVFLTFRFFFGNSRFQFNPIMDEIQKSKIRDNDIN